MRKYLVYPQIFVQSFIFPFFNSLRDIVLINETAVFMGSRYTIFKFIHDMFVLFNFFLSARLLFPFLILFI